jgi:hypothetical protein
MINIRVYWCLGYKSEELLLTFHTMFLKHRCLSIPATRFRPHIFRCYFLGAFQTV